MSKHCFDVDCRILTKIITHCLNEDVHELIMGALWTRKDQRLVVSKRSLYRCGLAAGVIVNDAPAAVVVCKETHQMPPRAQILLSDFDPRGQEVHFRNED